MCRLFGFCRMRIANGCSCACCFSFSSQPWCNSSLPIDVRVADMVSRMDLKTEKIPNLNTGGAPIKSLGLDRYNFSIRFGICPI